jgi:predicted enzyme related to lactoylglutathione lyase
MSNNTNTSTSAPKSVLNWFEIPVRDVSRALPLYSAMLDATLAPTELGGDPMVILGSNGCLVANSKLTGGKGGTVVYLNAHDGVRACLSRAVEAGAKVVLPETSIGEHGTIAQIEDLDGNVVGLHAEKTK